ncbi:hypothetical protein A5779_30450 [Mycolicibacterium peregrinum]|uniref:Uncharacterized protein n=1 Tax=Mycolicibacterium peregrinum TaxID=43304 RepID=A0A1A0VZ01_MYCPR|nr:hypothetical protein [Mycolicibacterium peregrinum]OBB88406.1 hypothetical protein A5779_30450 [Mycolicibacterium peregrinum]
MPSGDTESCSRRSNNRTAVVTAAPRKNRVPQAPTALCSREASAELATQADIAPISTPSTVNINNRHGEYRAENSGTIRPYSASTPAPGSNFARE